MFLFLFNKLAIPPFQNFSRTGPHLLPFLLSSSCCIPDRIYSPPTWASIHTKPVVSCVVINNISKYKVCSGCFKMLKLWSSSHMLSSCECLLSSVHTTAQSEAPFQFWKRVSLRTAGNLSRAFCFFINIVSILVFKEKRGKGSPHDRILNFISSMLPVPHHKIGHPFPLPHAYCVVQIIPSGMTFLFLELGTNYQSVFSLWNSSSCILVIGTLFKLIL